MVPTMDLAQRRGDASGDDPDELAAAVGLVTGVGLGVPLWLILTGLVLLGRPHIDPVFHLVRTWAAVFVG